jgi:hypothetical protein
MSNLNTDMDTTTTLRTPEPATPAETGSQSDQGGQRPTELAPTAPATTEGAPRQTEAIWSTAVRHPPDSGQRLESTVFPGGAGDFTARRPGESRAPAHRNLSDRFTAVASSSNRGPTGQGEPTTADAIPLLRGAAAGATGSCGELLRGATGSCGELLRGAGSCCGEQLRTHYWCRDSEVLRGPVERLGDCCAATS